MKPHEATRKEIQHHPTMKRNSLLSDLLLVGVFVLVTVLVLGLTGSLISHRLCIVDALTLKAERLESTNGKSLRYRLPESLAAKAADANWMLLAKEGLSPWQRLVQVDPRYQKSQTVREVTEVGAGRYILRRRLLYFSSHDGAGPGTKDRSYKIVIRPKDYEDQVRWWRRVVWIADGAVILLALGLLMSRHRGLGASLWERVRRMTGESGTMAARLVRSAPSCLLGSGTCCINLSLCRAALALAAFLSLQRAAGNIRSYPEGAASYLPNGILALWTGQPTWHQMETVSAVAAVSTLCWMFGLFTRASCFVSFAANLIVITYLESFSPAWSHGYNLVFLALFPFLLAPAGNLSLDRLLFSRGSPWRAEPLWPIFLGALSVGLVFTNAAFHKLTAGGSGWTLDWALSDNMRNVLLIQHQYIGMPIPWYLQIIADHPILYKSIAVANLICQGGAILACMFFRRPWLRLAFGSLFVLEEAGLASVMHLFDWQWLPLLALFVDFDYFLGLKKRPGSKTEEDHRCYMLPGPVAASILGVFFAVFGIVAFLLPPDTHFRWRSYPFTQFRMYSDIKSTPRSVPELRWHFLGSYFRAYDREGNRLETDERELQSLFRTPGASLNGKSMASLLRLVESAILTRLDPVPSRVELHRALWRPSPPPTPARLDLVTDGLIAEFDKGRLSRHCGVVAGYSEAKQKYWIDPITMGLDDSLSHLELLLVNSDKVVDLKPEREGARMYFRSPATKPESQALFMVYPEVESGESRWLVHLFLLQE